MFGRRISVNKTPGSNSKGKMLKKSPTTNSSNELCESEISITPKHGKTPPKIQSEQKENVKNLNKKRKSLPSKLTNGDNDDCTAKKPKIEPFTGTSDLFMQMKKENSQFEKKKTNKLEQNKANNDAQSSNTTENLSNRTKRKDKLAALRIANKEKFKKSLSNAAAGDQEAISYIKNKILEIKKRPKLSKNARRKLSKLRNALKESGADDIDFFMKQISTDENAKVTKKQILKVEKQKVKQNNLNKMNEKKTQKSIKKENQMQIKKEEEESDDGNAEESDDDNEEESENDSGDEEMKTKSIKQEIKEEDESDLDNEEESENDDEQEDESENDSNNLVEEKSAVDEGEEEEEVSENESDDKTESDSEVEDNVQVNIKNKKVISKKESQIKPLEKQVSNTLSSNPNSQSRYVLFVGNLPYDVTKEEIAKHFAKVGSAKDIRIPLDKKTNKCKGFAYVELLNQVAYEKALSLHHTTIKGRRINVLYTQGGKKKGEEKKKEIKAKNFKLKAMRQEGKLAGSIKQSQKRAARREKRRSANKKE